jgi:hypothetical protein
VVHPPDVVTSSATLIKRRREHVAVAFHMSSSTLLLWRCREMSTTRSPFGSRETFSLFQFDAFRGTHADSGDFEYIYTD